MAVQYRDSVSRAPIGGWPNDLPAFTFSGNGRIWAPPQHLECAGDGEAVAYARTLGDGQVIEVWESGRLVASVDPEFLNPTPCFLATLHQSHHAGHR